MSGHGLAVFGNCRAGAGDAVAAALGVGAGAEAARAGGAGAGAAAGTDFRAASTSRCVSTCGGFWVTIVAVNSYPSRRSVKRIGLPSEFTIFTPRLAAS